MTPLEAVLLVLSGLVGGIVNTVAGGGSMITLPALIFLGGLPAGAANATNRVAVLVQSVAATTSFTRQKVPGLRVGLILSIVACIGSAAGAYLATVLSDAVLRRVIGIALLATLYPVIRPPRRASEKESVRVTPFQLFAFLLLGVYGGLVQVAIGVLILVLFSLEGASLIEGNVVKVVVVASLTVVALVIFVFDGLVAWVPGALVAVGSAAGGWFGASLSVKRGEPFIRVLLVLAAVVASGQLLFG